MQERAINISSIDRQKIGQSRPEDFIIKFDPVMHLDTEMNHELAVDRVSMTYSWHNVNNWKAITFTDGMYSYEDISDYINGVISHNDDQPSNNRVGIKIYFVLS